MVSTHDPVALMDRLLDRQQRVYRGRTFTLALLRSKNCTLKTEREQLRSEVRALSVKVVRGCFAFHKMLFSFRQSHCIHIQLWIYHGRENLFYYAYVPCVYEDFVAVSFSIKTAHSSGALSVKVVWRMFVICFRWKCWNEHLFLCAHDFCSYKNAPLIFPRLFHIELTLPVKLSLYFASFNFKHTAAFSS